MPIFKTPFSGAYWRTAALEVKNYRSIVFSALMIAACIVLSHCTIRVGEGLSISVTFLARALCSLVCGPVMVILFGAAEDTLSFFLSSGGYPYFPGYMLTTILGCIVYVFLSGPDHLAPHHPGKAPHQHPKCFSGLSVERHSLQQGIPVLYGHQCREKRPVPAAADLDDRLFVSGTAAGAGSAGQAA